MVLLALSLRCLLAVFRRQFPVLVLRQFPAWLLVCVLLVFRAVSQVEFPLVPQVNQVVFLQVLLASRVVFRHVFPAVFLVLFQV